MGIRVACAWCKKRFGNVANLDEANLIVQQHRCDQHPVVKRVKQLELEKRTILDEILKKVNWLVERQEAADS